MKVKPIPLIIAIVGAVGLWWTSQNPTPAPDAPEKPSTELMALVEPIASTDYTAEDAAALAAFCDEFADVLERDADAGVISDTAELHDRLEQSSKLMFQNTGIAERHPSTAGRINTILAEALGIQTDDGVEVIDLDDAARAKAVAAFRALAWAANE